MTRAEARKLANGVYRIWWKNGGGRSVAAIGRDPDGSVWVAPANWIRIDTNGFQWAKVERVELIEASPS